jgi:hypothetical protein
MRHEHWHGIVVWRANVRELDIQPVNPGDELRHRVQLRLNLSPVVGLSPMLHEWLKLG